MHFLPGAQVHWHLFILGCANKCFGSPNRRCIEIMKIIVVALSTYGLCFCLSHIWENMEGNISNFPDGDAVSSQTTVFIISESVGAFLHGRGKAR